MIFDLEYAAVGDYQQKLQPLIMGHSDISVTWQAYAVFTVDELKAAHARYSPVAYLERQAANGSAAT